MKKVLKISLILLSIIVVTLSILVYSMSDKIKNVALSEINKQLAVEGSFKDVNIAFWKTFPKISVEISGLKLTESTPLLGKPFVESESVWLQFNLLKAFKKQYELEKVSASNLTVSIAVKGKQNNFQLFKENTDSAENSSFKLDLSAISLKNSKIEYYDLEDSLTIIYDFDKVKSKGSIESEKVNFSVDAQGLGETFILFGEEYPLAKSTKLISELSYEFEPEILTIRNGSLNIDGSPFDVSGNFVFSQTDSMELNFESKGDRLEKITGLIPGEGGKILSKLKSEGDFSVKARIFGKFGGDNIPMTHAFVRINNGKVFPAKGSEPMEKINLKADLKYGKKEEYLKVPMLSFSMGGHDFKADFDLNGFSDPYVNGKFLGKIELGFLDKLFDFQNIDLGGLINCDLDIKGKISELSSGKQFKEKGLLGNMSWTNVSFREYDGIFSDWILASCSADWKLEGNTISSPNVKGRLNDSPFDTDIRMTGLLPYIFDEGILQLKSNFTADRVVMPAWMFEDAEDGDTSQTDLFVIFPDNSNFDVNFNIKEFSADDLRVNDFKGSLFVSDKNMKLFNGTGKTADGNFNTDITLSKRGDNFLMCNIDLYGSGMNINTLFRTFDNFGQEEITYKNLEGSLDVNTQIVLILGRDGDLSRENLYAFAELTITDGILKDYETLESLSNYVELSELKNIRFAKLTNTIEISDGEMNFPYMNVGNSALNLKIKGKHNFDNYMDYTFRVKLSEALASKFKKKKKAEFNEYEELDDKGIALYINMKGYPDDLQFKVEKVGGSPVLTSESVKEGVKNAKQEFSETIKQEFSIQKREERKQQEAEDETVEWDE